MANLCSFMMNIKGEKDNVSKFLDALAQKEYTYIGRGACIDSTIDDYDEEKQEIVITGSCKWSLISALVDDAIEMRENPDRWSFNKDPSKLTFITLFEACEMYHVNMEAYSEESGVGFQEHFKYENGEILTDCVDYTEYYLGEYKTKEEAEKDLDISISEEDWGDEYARIGGYENWDFSVSSPN